MSISSNLDSLNFLPKEEPEFEEDESPINDDGEEFNTKGIRVLLVDADANSLRLMNDLLTNFSYQVTSYNKGEEAMSYMKTTKDEIDLVLWDYHMPDVNGVEALNTIGKEMDLPVVIISHDHEIETVENSVKYGAYDFLVKPLSKEVAIVLWRHVFRKMISKKSTVDSNSTECDLEDVDHSNEEGSKNSVDQNTNSNRKGEKSSSKKHRMTWDNELHSKFVLAVQKLGSVENAVPKQILKIMEEEMHVEGLTRNNVASHLQKYRQNAAGKKTNAPQETQEDYRSAPNVAPPTPVLHSSLDQFGTRGLYPYNSTMQPAYPYAPSNLTMNNVNNTIFLNNSTNPTNPSPKQPAYIDPYYFPVLRPRQQQQDYFQQQQQEYPQQQQQDYYYPSLQPPSVVTKQDPEVNIQLPFAMTKQDPEVGVPPLNIHDDLIYGATLPYEPDFFEQDLSKCKGFDSSI